MLVSLMSKLNAISLKSNAQYAMMQNHSNMMNAIQSPTFGALSLRDAHLADMNFGMNNDYYQTLYLLTSAQEKAAAQLLNHQAQNYKISYIA